LIGDKRGQNIRVDQTAASVHLVKVASEQRLTDGPDGPGGRTASASPLTLSHRYTLDHPLGRGGMADVYRGHDDLLDRSVAVKIFRAGSGGAGNAIRQESEMRVLG
jgi:hypothetical protein